MNRKLLFSPLLLASCSRAFQPSVRVSLRRALQPQQLPGTVRRSLATQLPPDYHERAAANSFAPPREVVRALKGPNTYVLDVRGPDEIATARLSVEDGVTWVTSPCSKAECPGLEADAEALLPDRDATVVVHCASGIRANTARQTLERLGYTNVLNAGGLQDVMAYLQEE